MNVKAVYHRPGAIWPFTSVGRPPQEDTSFGAFIHELTKPLIPRACCREYTRFTRSTPRASTSRCLRSAASVTSRSPRNASRGNCSRSPTALLGQGQLSLAKYLWIAAKEDDPSLDVNDVRSFFRHVLERVDWRRDVHFQTGTTIDTLKTTAARRSNEGSKVVIAAAGTKKRELATAVPGGVQWPDGFRSPRFCLPGVLAVSSPKHDGGDAEVEPSVHRFIGSLRPNDLPGVALIVLADDADFVASSLENFLWVAFTRSNPADDLHGIGAFTRRRHWGCEGPLVIDARLKPHHRRRWKTTRMLRSGVDAMARPGGPLYGLV